MHQSLSAVGPEESRHGGDKLTDIEVRLELERILQSQVFQRSERLQRFLRFVCESTLKGEGHRLHEYLIGSEVFGRGADYSPQEDSIVRRQAHSLRRKLQEYYEREGADDPVRIDLPVGRYVPVFRRNQPAPAVRASPPNSERPAAAPARRTARVRFITSIAVGGLFWVGWLMGHRSISATASSSFPAEVRELWGPWFQQKDGVTLCFSNPLTAVVKHYPELLAPDSQPPRKLLTPDQAAFYRSIVPLPPEGYLYFAPAISQAKMGEAIAGIHITALFARAGLPVRATQSRFVTWEDLTRENMILFGHNEANPWLDRILKDYPYRLTPTRRNKQRSIVNSQAGPGEASEYHIHYGDTPLTATEEYALVSMLPGVDGRHLLLLINGLNTQATQIAAEYLTASERLQELRAELRKRDPAHSGVWYFQAVLRTEVHDKVPTKATLVDLKVLRP